MRERDRKRENEREREREGVRKRNLERIKIKLKSITRRKERVERGLFPSLKFITILIFNRMGVRWGKEKKEKENGGQQLRE